MKSIITIMVTAALGTSLSAQEPNCWHYENGDAPIIGSVETHGLALCVAVSSDYAYVVDYLYEGETGSLQVINITNSEEPILEGNVSMPDMDSYSEYDIAVTGNYACVVGSVLYVIDISNPETPWIVGSVNTPYPLNSVVVVGDYAYVTASDFGLYIVDIMNPENPFIASSLSLPNTTYSVAVSSNYAYVGSRNQLNAINIADIENPWVAASVPMPDFPGDVVVNGCYAYVVANDSPMPAQYVGYILVVDITNPPSMQIVDSMQMSVYPETSSLGSVAISDNYIYTTGHVDYLFSGLRVFDISIPSFLSIVGDMDTGWPFHVVISENNVYIAGFDDGLQIAWRQCEDVVSIEDDPNETDPEEEVPGIVQYFAVHPNPFNPLTKVHFTLASEQHVTLSVFDVTGQRLVNLAAGIFDAGEHTVEWRGTDAMGRAMPSGTYIVRLETETGVEARKVMLVR